MKNINIKFAITLICLAVVLFLATWVIFSCTPTAYADSEVEVVLAPVSNLKDNATAGVSTLKLNHKGTSEDIYIPESYYIKDIRKIEFLADFYSVSYCDTEFYYMGTDLKTTTVSFADGVNPSPDVRLTLKDDVTATIEGALVTNDYTIKLIGYNQSGTQVYVRATINDNSYYGFVPVDSFKPFTVPYHPIAQAERDELIADIPEPVIPGGDIVPNTSLALRIILIIGIAVPAVIIALLLFKPTKSTKRMLNNKRKDEYDYDDPRRRDRADDLYSGRDRADDLYSGRDRADDRYADRRDNYDDRYAPRRNDRYDDRYDNDRYNR